MRTRVILLVTIAVWAVSSTTVLQQLREASILARHSRQWDNYGDYQLPLHFAGRTLSIVESAPSPGSSPSSADRPLAKRAVAVKVDEAIVLPSALLKTDSSRTDLYRYHRWISATRFRTTNGGDSLLVLGRQRVDQSGTRFDILKIDGRGRVTVHHNVESAGSSGIMAYRVLSQLGQESPPYLPLSEWSVFPGFLLRYLAPWILVVLTSVSLIVRCFKRVDRGQSAFLSRTD